MSNIQIPKYFINIVKDLLGEKANKLSKKVFKINIETFIEEISLQEFSMKDAIEVRKYTFKNNFQKTKKRWVDSLKKSMENSPPAKKKELLAELDMAREMMDRYGMERFQEFYQVHTLEELAEKRIQEIEEWQEDSSKRMIDYLYIMDKTKLQLQKALTTDVTLAVADILLQRFNGNLNSIIVETPNYLVDNAVYADGLSKIKVENEIININNEPYYTSTYNGDEGYQLNVLIKKELVDNEELAQHCLKTLDPRDNSIFHEVMKNRNIEFMSNRKIYLEVGKLVNEVYGSDNSNNYRRTVSRLIKMANMKFNVVKPNEVYVFGIFDSLRIVEHEHGSQLAEITVNEEIHQQYIKDQVTRMYSDKIKKLEVGPAKNLIFPLQKERLDAFVKNNSSQTVLSYNFFSSKMQFRQRSKQKNYEIIEKCLQEFVDQGVTVKSYMRKSSYFYINFLPVARYEIEDFLQGHLDDSILDGNFFEVSEQLKLM